MSLVNSAPKRVLIFDSGVGGLSIHQALKVRRPDLEYLFVSDNAAYPYGTKDEEELIERVQKVLKSAIELLEPDLVVIACNTASTVVLDVLREAHSFPFVGVVPAIKPAARISQSKKIAVLATPATAKRQYTLDLITQFAPDCEVRTVGSSELVDLAEKKLRSEALDLSILKHQLAPILEFTGCDTLVLSCTHFPILIKEIEDMVSASSIKNIVDSGEAIARRVCDLVGEPQNSGETLGQSWMTQNVQANSELITALNIRRLPYQGVLKL